MKEPYYIYTFVIVLLCLFIWLAPATADQINACVEKTGWTEARCKQELNR